MKKCLIKKIYLKDVGSDEELIAIRSDKIICDQLDIDLKNINDNSIKLFEDNYGIYYKDIIAYGSVDNVTHNLLVRLISYKYVTINNDKGKSTVIKSYKCFDNAIDENNINNYPTNPIQHQNVESSWKCLIEAFNKAKYIIIYKRKKNE